MLIKNFPHNVSFSFCTRKKHKVRILKKYDATTHRKKDIWRACVYEHILKVCMQNYGICGMDFIDKFIGILTTHACTTGEREIGVNPDASTLLLCEKENPFTRAQRVCLCGYLLLYIQYKDTHIITARVFGCRVKKLRRRGLGIRAFYLSATWRMINNACERAKTK